MNTQRVDSTVHEYFFIKYICYYVTNKNIIRIIQYKQTKTIMRKKEFNEYCSYHLYGKNNENGVKAIFFDWKNTEFKTGYKYCVFARANNITKRELFDSLYKLVHDENYDLPWWVNCVIAPNDKYRFKVPLVSSGLNKLITHKL